jgi:hypothetical protein
VTWTVDELDSGEVHVAPLFDTIEHALHDDCHCGQHQKRFRAMTAMSAGCTRTTAWTAESSGKR